MHAPGSIGRKIVFKVEVMSFSLHQEMSSLVTVYLRTIIAINGFRTNLKWCKKKKFSFGGRGACPHIATL